jgi:hypothetical protein
VAGSEQQPIDLPRFERSFLRSEHCLTRIGEGATGGKGAGLALAARVLAESFDATRFPAIEVSIPRTVVLTTDAFVAFVERNGLALPEDPDEPDERIAHAFQRADLPVEIVGDLRALVEELHEPLAVRSSSRLEDALYRPFAGVYETKMIPNNQPDADTRFRRLSEAIKLVWASTWFRGARDYLRTTSTAGEPAAEPERMAVVLQEVVGRRFGERHYPHVSGVARSFNHYPSGRARPEEGVVSLALGLGKTIVDGGVSWSYSPAWPQAPPPFAGAREMADLTQTRFWAVNMGRPPAYDPIAEVEYLVHADLADAEYDGTLDRLASTYDPRSERIVPGLHAEGPRVLSFAPLLQSIELPLNDVLRTLLEAFERALAGPVEIEFALTIAEGPPARGRLGFLQVRPMVGPGESVDLSPEALAAEGVLVASERVMGHGVDRSIADVVYVRPERFERAAMARIAGEIERINRTLVREGRPYLLIGFGRWGSADPWLGIPVQWSQIAGARAIVEATLPDVNVDPSQGSHFFHNLSSLRVSYFMVQHSIAPPIDWAWLDAHEAVAETEHVRHVRPAAPLEIVVDGRSGRGRIRREAAA